MLSYLGWLLHPAAPRLVRRAGYSYDQLEDWVRTTLTAALLAGA